MSRGDSLIHVERQILLTAMLRASSLPDMPLLPKHFASEQHADLWELVLELSQDAKPFDAVSVSDAAARLGRRALADLAITIAGAHDNFPASDARYPSGLLVTAWRDREARAIAAQLADEASRREEGAIDRAISALMALHAEDRDCEHTAKSAMRLAWDEVLIAKQAGGRIIGVPTGLVDLDETLGGLHDSDLIVIGARPAMGKTGMLLGMTMAGSRDGHPVGLISGEQPAAQVGLRWMAAGADVSVGRLRAARIEEHQWSRLSRAVTETGERAIRILDRSSPDIAEVTRVARRWKHQYGIRALYVDYLQKLEISALVKSPKHERIGAIARALKNLARDLQIPVVALAQVNRKVDESPTQRPGMSHLADSSEIEKEADQIMMLWRDQTNPLAETAAAEINVVKNRHGNIGTVHCLWRGGQTAFVNLARDQYPEAA